MNQNRIPNLEVVWAERTARVQAVQARTDPTGMTRPRRDPDERRFLTGMGQLGPFIESDVGLVIVPLDVPKQRNDLL
jgi:hypothetical protein